MNGIQWLVNTPKVIPKQGRIVKLIDLKQSEPTGRPSTAHPAKEVNAKWYAANKEKVLEQRRQYRIAKRDLLNRKARERRAAAKAAREHAGVRGDSGSVQSV